MTTLFWEMRCQGDRGVGTGPDLCSSNAAGSVAAANAQSGEHSGDTLVLGETEDLEEKGTILRSPWLCRELTAHTQELMVPSPIRSAEGRWTFEREQGSMRVVPGTLMRGEAHRCFQGKSRARPSSPQSGTQLQDH